MLYFAFFFCPCHTIKVQLFDENQHKPCIGGCGHTVCLACVEKTNDCPLCRREDAFVKKTPNYQSMEIMKDCRTNFLALFENWRSGKGLGSGDCSKCSIQCDSIRICSTCHPDLCQPDSNGEMELCIPLQRDLSRLSKCLVCADCALEFHVDLEHKSIRMDNLKIGPNLKKITAQVILTLFKEESDNLPIRCKLRSLKLKETSLLWPLGLGEEPNGIKEFDCENLAELIKIEMVRKFIKNIGIEMNSTLNGPLCQCTVLYEKMKKSKTKVNFDEVYKQMSASRIEELAMDCPFHSKRNIDMRLKIFYILKMKPQKLEMPIWNPNKECSLCLLFDYSDSATNINTDYYRKNCMKIYENYWKSEMPSIASLCFRCLFQLNNNMIISYHVGKVDCDNEECLLKIASLWKYVIKLAVRDNAFFMMKQQITGADIDRVKRSGSMKKLEEMDRLIGEIDLRKDTEEELMKKVVKVDEVLEALKSQWNTSYASRRSHLSI